MTLSGNAEKRVRRRYTQDPETYLLYCQGRHLMHKFTAENFRRSIDRFQSAIDRDPQFALGYVGLAEAYILLAYEFQAPKEAFPLALAYALEAERIDPKLGEAHASLGAIRLQYQWDWAEAE